MIRFHKRKENILIFALAILFVIMTSAYGANSVYEDSFSRVVDKGIESTSFLNIDSVGGDIFKNFYQGLNVWFKGDGANPGIYQKFADAVKTPFEIGLMLAFTIIGIAMYFGKWMEHARKFIKFFFASIIFIGFLDYNTFAYWIYDPLIGIMIGVMRLLFDVGGDVSLTDAIFGVDQHFNKLYEAIDVYRQTLSAGSAWYQFYPFETLILFLMMIAFGALYAIFTILIIVGFFGFMLLLSFAPIFMAIGVFHKGIFLSWIKSVANYFLIPIFTAAVMSVTVSFIGDAANVIAHLKVGESLFVADVGFVFIVAVFSVGLHWKAPEFAAAITGGMASGAGSIVGTAAALGGTAWALSKNLPKGSTNLVSGARGGSWGNPTSATYKGGQAMQGLYERYRKGGRLHEHD